MTKIHSPCLLVLFLIATLLREQLDGVISIGRRVRRPLCTARHPVVANYIQSITGCLSHERKTGNQTDQSKSPYPMTSAILIGQFDFTFYVPGTSTWEDA